MDSNQKFSVTFYAVVPCSSQIPRHSTELTQELSITRPQHFKDYTFCNHSLLTTNCPSQSTLHLAPSMNAPIPRMQDVTAASEAGGYVAFELPHKGQ
jgi:hypothetical protein